MGVKLQPLIDRKTFDLKSLKGKVAAVDALNIIYQLFSFTYKPGAFLENIMVDRTKRAIPHLYGLLYRIKFYYTKGIFPIFVFDGRDSYLKRRITEDQHKKFQIAKENYEKAMSDNNLELARKISLSRDFFWINTINESKQLINALGIPLIDAPASGESQCAELVRQRIANFTISQDLDSLLFGSNIMIQNLSKSRKRKIQGRWEWKKISPLKISLSQVLKQLKIDRFQLVDIAILIGVDYFKGIRGVGPKTALSLIKRYKSLEQVMEGEQKNYDFSALSPSLIKRIRRIFLSPEVIKRFNNFTWSYPDTKNVLKLMCEDHTLGRQKVENNLNNLAENFKRAKKYYNNLKNGITVRRIQTKLPIEKKPMKKLVF